MSWLYAARMAGSQWSASSPPATSHKALATSFVWAGCRFPLSVCVCMFGVIVFVRFSMSLLWGLLTLAVRYMLTLWYEISHNTEWEETAGGVENRERGGEGR